MADDLLDLALGLHVLENLARDRAVDLHAVDKGGNGDETVCVDFLVKTVGLLLVESDGVLGLVLDCMNVALVQVRLAFSSGLDIEGSNVAEMGLCPILSHSEVEDLAARAAKPVFHISLAPYSPAHSFSVVVVYAVVMTVVCPCPETAARPYRPPSKKSFHIPLPLDHFFFCFPAAYIRD